MERFRDSRGAVQPGCHPGRRIEYENEEARVSVVKAALLLISPKKALAEKLHVGVHIDDIQFDAVGPDLPVCPECGIQLSWHNPRNYIGNSVMNNLFPEVEGGDTAGPRPWPVLPCVTPKALNLAVNVSVPGPGEGSRRGSQELQISQSRALQISNVTDCLTTTPDHPNIFTYRGGNSLIST